MIKTGRSWLKIMLRLIMERFIVHTVSTLSLSYWDLLSIRVRSIKCAKRPKLLLMSSNLRIPFSSLLEIITTVFYKRMLILLSSLKRIQNPSWTIVLIYRLRLRNFMTKEFSK
jgi:hypothetical protein